MDSAVCLALAAAKHGDVLCLGVNYGQKHSHETEAAECVAKEYGVGYEVIQLPADIFGTKSTIMQGGPDNPHLTYQEIAESEGPSPTYVPYRNGTLLSLAAAYALTHDAQYIYAGMHAEDARNWAYPDCTPEFIGAVANAIFVGTYQKVRLITPLQWMMKADVVRIGWDLHVPFRLTLSCYEGSVPACGKCPTCVERIAAFHANGLTDPIGYEL